eukprot:TRINITY_DN43767_c0_g1_i1.p1 TRINITY_DN43767_c0_g1~~TRINITY_DN43767_c0_g1_i1.p1  ORF type:complete len:501 (-),score=68.75 TRINITY_DN43767_c0_g1_i1:56-1531(-)
MSAADPLSAERQLRRESLSSASQISGSFLLDLSCLREDISQNPFPVREELGGQSFDSSSVATTSVCTTPAQSFCQAPPLEDDAAVVRLGSLGSLHMDLRQLRSGSVSSSVNRPSVQLDLRGLRSSVDIEKPLERLDLQGSYSNLDFEKLGERPLAAPRRSLLPPVQQQIPEEEEAIPPTRLLESPQFREAPRHTVHFAPSNQRERPSVPKVPNLRLSQQSLGGGPSRASQSRERSLTSSSLSVPRLASGPRLSGGEIDLLTARSYALSTRESTLPGLDEERGPSEKGPCWDPHVWSYYRECGAWSDGLCVSLQRPQHLAQCLCPPLWIWRLWRTLRRALPLEVDLCGRVVQLKTAAQAWCAALSVIALLCTFSVGALLWAVLGGLGRCSGLDRCPGKVIVLLSAPGVAALSWSALLVAVGRKYNISDILRGGRSAFFKTCCCVCAMNVRVGMHVDRAQGFFKPTRAVEVLVEVMKARQEGRGLPLHLLHQV